MLSASHGGYRLSAALALHGGTTVVVPGELSRVLELLPGGGARRSRFPWRHQ